MNLSISDEKTIKTLQDEFSSFFPYLKLEFFSKSHSKFESSNKNQMKSNLKVLGDCRKIHTNGSISINANMTVADLETIFKEKYGLNIQIFRKSGTSWLETTATDNWSLLKQNQQGEELSNFATRKEIDEYDYD